jgi:hypothetical protein
MHAVRHLKEMAEECRLLATVAKADEIREQLLEVAEQFSRLAQHREIQELMQIRTPHRSMLDT